MADELTNTYPLSQAPANAGTVFAAPYPPDEYHKVLALTERLFPGSIDVRHERDPEIQGHEYLVFNVSASGTVDDAVARDAQWHRELARIALHSSNVYCLNIDVQAGE